MSKAKELLSLVEQLKKQTDQGGESPPHSHGFKVDDKGNGKTNSTSKGDDHPHEIEKFMTLSGGKGPHDHGNINPDLNQDHEDDPGTHQPAGMF